MNNPASETHFLYDLCNSRREQGGILGIAGEAWTLCTSTQDIIKQRRDAGAPHGYIALADEQNHGRGRMGRIWLSPTGGLYVSLLVRPQAPIHVVPRLTMLTCAALFEAISSVLSSALSSAPISNTNQKLAIKWPNDVVFVEQSHTEEQIKQGQREQRGQRDLHTGQQSKLAGILVESSLHTPIATPPVVESAIIGFGINLAPLDADNSAGLRLPAASLNHICSRATLLSSILSALDRWLGPPQICQDDQHFARCIDLLRKNSSTLGRFVEVPEQGAGIAVEIADDGALWIETAEKQKIRVIAGEVW